MRETGAHLYLATSKRTVFARRILDHLELAGCFSGIHGSEPGGGLDEKPELIAHVVKRHGLRNEQCLMVGDRRYDISGAHANRMRAIGVLWGYGSRDELESAGADHLVGTPDDLANAALLTSR
jgi:phosphoglycolate phosphatase